MVHDGAVLRGAWGNAGEIGHMPVVPDGEPCPCGNRGCLERYLSLEAFGGAKPSEADWVRKRGADLPQRHRHDREPVRSRNHHPRRPGVRPTCSSGWPALAANLAQFDLGATRPQGAAPHRGARRRSTRCCAAPPHLPCPACCRRASARCSPATRERDDPAAGKGDRRMTETAARARKHPQEFRRHRSAARHQLFDRQRRGGGAARRQRRRQIDAGQDHRRRARADLRPHAVRGQGVPRQIARRGQGRRHRDRLPGPVALHQCRCRRQFLHGPRDHQKRSRHSRPAGSARWRRRSPRRWPMPAPASRRCAPMSSISRAASGRRSSSTASSIGAASWCCSTNPLPRSASSRRGAAST